MSHSEGSKSRNSHSDVLDCLKSRYPCIHQPQNHSAATIVEDEDDEDIKYLTPLWVFGTQDIDEPESPLPSSKCFIIYVLILNIYVHINDRLSHTVVAYFYKCRVLKKLLV